MFWIKKHVKKHAAKQDSNLDFQADRLQWSKSRLLQANDNSCEKVKQEGMLPTGFYFTNGVKKRAYYFY